MGWMDIGSILQCFARLSFVILAHKISIKEKDEMATILQMMFWNVISWLKSFRFWLEFQWSLFPRIQLTTIDNKFVMTSLIGWELTKGNPYFALIG